MSYFCRSFYPAMRPSVFRTRNSPILPCKQQKQTETCPYISVPQIWECASTFRSKWLPGRLKGIRKKSKTNSPYCPLSGHCPACPPPFLQTTPPTPQGLPFWSQNPLCQRNSSPAFSCSTHHVTLENLQGIFHLASATRGHRDPKLPAFSGLAAPAKASHGGGRRAPLGGS